VQKYAEIIAQLIETALKIHDVDLADKKRVKETISLISVAFKAGYDTAYKEK
jgi:hypothetical protein